MRAAGAGSQARPPSPRRGHRRSGYSVTPHSPPLLDVSFLQSSRAWARRIKRDAVTLWFAGRHPRTPWPARLLGLFVVAYALSPIDLIPDFVPVLGYLDDVLLLPALIWLTVRLLPGDVLAECRGQAEDWMARAGSKPRSRWGAALVIAIWIGLSLALWYGWIAPRLA